jgi:hypothetical protein
VFIITTSKQTTGIKVMTATAVTYSNKANPSDLVLIKEDDSFVVVGDTTPSDSDLEKMTGWDDVEGWSMSCHRYN